MQSSPVPLPPAGEIAFQISTFCHLDQQPFCSAVAPQPSVGAGGRPRMLKAVGVVVGVIQSPTGEVKSFPALRGLRPSQLSGQSEAHLPHL
ncbi:hypothetical protein NQZ68_000489 [Dissostichus eleginoides]|nr:hypothetical protein NQZ68_000489 [Dissostichus eleginoides]